ncbi:hypothetical protein BGX28_006878 [Mortierella sp. GBA30]|nr:hypothetical protein BGX28_006878 [Mortierella sp. GBA30]
MVVYFLLLTWELMLYTCCCLCVCLGRPYTSKNENESGHASNSRAQYPASATPYHTSYPSCPPPSSTLSAVQESSRQHYGRQSHYDRVIHGGQDGQEEASPRDNAGGKHSLQSSYKEHAQTHMQPSPQGRPPSLKINTAVRQSYPKQPQHQQAGPNSSRTPSTRHYTLPGLSTSSAQSSPVTNIDYQSHIPPPLTPKDDHVSPTSAHSPAPGQNLKRKSVHHDAVMDAVRAKVLRNAGQNQQQREQQQQQQQQQQHQHLHKKTSTDFNGRRKAHPLTNGSPERLKKPLDSVPTARAGVATTVAGPTSKQGSTPTVIKSPSSRVEVEVKYEEPLSSVLPSSGSPISSPTTPPSANGGGSHSGSGPSRSMSPVPSVVAEDSSSSSTRQGERAEDQNGISKSPAREGCNNNETMMKEEKTSRYRLDRSHSERSNEIGGER